LKKAFAKTIDLIPSEFISAGLRFLEREECASDLGGFFSIFIFINDTSGIKMNISVGKSGISSTIVILNQNKFFDLEDYLTAHKPSLQ